MKAGINQQNFQNVLIIIYDGDIKLCGGSIIKNVLIILLSVLLLMIPGSGYSDEIVSLVEKMSTRELIGQKLIVGPPWMFPTASSNYLDEDKKTSEEYLKELIKNKAIPNYYLSRTGYRDWMGFREEDRCLFSNNEDFPRLNSTIIRREASFIKQLSESQNENKILPLIFVDFEGGRVQSIRGSDLPDTPSPMNVATIRDMSLALNYSRAVGKFLRNLSINGNFAPVIDINYEGDISLIGTRAFGSHTELVIDMANAFLLGQIENGIAPVLKHWPGHGSVSKIPDGADINIDFHKYNEPLEVNTSIDSFKQPYKKLLDNELIKKHVAIMTSHLIVGYYKKNCTDGGKSKIITFCEYAIDKLRAENNFQDGVVIADDIAYLKAVSNYSLYEILKNTFDAGHDMAIIASLVPSYHCQPNSEEEKSKCDDEYKVGDHSISFKNLDYAIRKLEEYYSDDDRNRFLKQSVIRVLNWKKNLSLLNHATEDKVKAYDKTVNYDKLKKDIQNYYNEIIESSVVLISPNDEGYIDNFQTELNINKEHTLLVVGPTLSVNDLEKAFNEIKAKRGASEFPEAIHHNLPYRDNAIGNSKRFIKIQFEKLWHLTLEKQPDYLIYGLINKPAHLTIWKKLRHKIKTMERPPQLILICFHVPSVLTQEDFDSSDIVIATFSNQYYANKNIAEMICGISGRTPKPIKYLPVDIIPQYHRVNSRPDSWKDSHINEIVQGYTVLATMIESFRNEKETVTDKGQGADGTDKKKDTEYENNEEEIIKERLERALGGPNAEYLTGILFIILSYPTVFMFLCSGSIRKQGLAVICLFVSCFLYTFADHHRLSGSISEIFNINKLLSNQDQLVTVAIVGFLLPIAIYLVIIGIRKLLRGKEREETATSRNRPKLAEAETD